MLWCVGSWHQAARLCGLEDGASVSIHRNVSPEEDAPPFPSYRPEILHYRWQFPLVRKIRWDSPLEEVTFSLCVSFSWIVSLWKQFLRLWAWRNSPPANGQGGSENKNGGGCTFPGSVLAAWSLVCAAPVQPECSDTVKGSLPGQEDPRPSMSVSPRQANVCHSTSLPGPGLQWWESP